jgi:hypothetical protein
MKRQPVILALIFEIAICGCERSPVTVKEMAGTYEYHGGNPAMGKICFKLKSDGSYLTGDASEPLGDLSMRGTPSSGTWALDGDSTGQKLWIGNSSLPIGKTPSSIRVNVNDDLGMYWDLPRTKN